MSEATADVIPTEVPEAPALVEQPLFTRDIAPPVEAPPVETPALPEKEAEAKEPPPLPKVEEPAAEAETKTEPEAVEPQADYTDLRQRYDEFHAGKGDPLTTDEKTRLGTYERTIEQRQTVQRQAAEAERQSRARLSDLGQRLPDRLLDVVQSEIDLANSEMRNVHPSLLKDALTKTANEFLAQAEPYVVLAYDARVRSTNYQLAQQLHGEATAREVVDLSHPYVDQLDYYGRLNYDLGHRNGTAEAAETKKIAQLETKVAKLEAELGKAKDERGKGSGPSSGGTPAGAAKYSVTPEQARALHASGDWSNDDMRIYQTGNR